MMLNVSDLPSSAKVDELAGVAISTAIVLVANSSNRKQVFIHSPRFARRMKT